MPTSRSRAPDPDRRECFNALYQRHYVDVLRYAWRRVGADDAEDVAHDTFTVAWRRLEEIPGSAELPWLYKTAGNLIRNRRRQVERDAVIMTALPPSGEPDHAEAVHDRQAALQMLASLGDSDQELLRLVAWEGLDASQVAEVLGCRRAAVHLRLHRLRKRLERLPDAPAKGGPHR